ncbi:hypothetical protein F0562_012449 [Nyssa sinensis]|uniref:Uncharacterized protein n=1 Tax=Nyssa sinensis TaxID=561372 RepID=A0A5J4ZVJ3_9ASTE|nr:hypothetical protein F0562_012449 [Nyssa sinensis]
MPSQSQEIFSCIDYINEQIGNKLPNARPPEIVPDIHRVPKSFRDLDTSAYTPKFISIGPLHSDNDNLQMRELKLRYMSDLVCRTPTPLSAWDACITELEPQARGCYAEARAYCYFRGQNRPERSSDPIFNNDWMIPVLRRDLMLFENQIPFFVLEELFRLTAGHMLNSSVQSLSSYVIDFFLETLHLETVVIQERLDTRTRGSHLLDLLRNCYFPTKKEAAKEDFKFRYSATELGRAGVKFRKSSGKEPFDAKFFNGTFELPHLPIYDSTESFFKNIIAFEQCCFNVSHRFTSFVSLMDALINSDKDVELLEQEEVIENNLGKSERVSTMFNNMCIGIVVKDDYFTEPCKLASDYYNSCWRNHLASFRSKYLRSPWAFISVIAAIVLFALTILQTVYSILSYY